MISKSFLINELNQGHMTSPGIVNWISSFWDFKFVCALATIGAASHGYVANNNKTAGGDSKKHSKT